MIQIEQMALILKALPDPAFIFSRKGQYVAVFGGRDERYYHDGSGLTGLYIAELIKAEKANWFIAQIEQALDTRKLLIVEYELSNKDVKGLSDEGPIAPIWFEGRIQALDFLVNDEEVVLWVASNISERHTLEVQLRELCDTDQLTGLFNRRRLERELSMFYAELLRYGTEVSVLAFDLDNLKQVNDTLGHHAGDELIKLAAEVCRTMLRKNDVACRFGGDEFVVAMPNTPHAQAMQFAHRLQEDLRVALARFTEVQIPVTASVGVATVNPQDPSYEEALKRADAALYQAKRMGKNMVVSSATELPELVY